MLLESDILRLFFTGPFLSPRLSVPVSGVDCPSILPRQLLFCCLPLCSPATNFSSLLSNYQLSTTACLSALQPPTASLWSLPLSGPRRQLSFASPYHFRVRRDFMSKNPLSGFAPKQTIESSALAAYPHSATYWEMCKKFKFDYTNKWYMHNPAPVLENDTQTPMGLWHTNGSPNLGQRTRPYNNQQKKRICKIVDFAVPADHRIKLKECEKKNKYFNLARELKKNYGTWKWQLYQLLLVLLVQ